MVKVMFVSSSLNQAQQLTNAQHGGFDEILLPA